MHRILLSWLFFFVITTSLPLFAMDTLTVDNTKELLASIQSNRVLLLSNTHYELPDEEVHLKDIQHLQLIGKNKTLVKIISKNYSNSVLFFEDCSHIQLVNLSIGHAELKDNERYSEACAVLLVSSKYVELQHCDLFGSSYGITIGNVSYLICRESVIQDCSQDLFHIDYNSTATFDHCTFFLNEKNQFDYQKPRFINCHFYDVNSTLLAENYNGYYPKKPLVLEAEIANELDGWDSEFGQDGLYENICANTVKITSSSQLSPYKGTTYETENLLNNKEEPVRRAWVEGKDDDGIGEQLIVHLTERVARYENWSFSAIFRIVNGYAKDKSTWEKNNRVKQFKVYRNGVLVAYVNLKDSPRMQEIVLQELGDKNEFNVGEILIFEISAVYKGSKYRDTAISLFLPTCSP